MCGWPLSAGGCDDWRAKHGWEEPPHIQSQGQKPGGPHARRQRPRGGTPRPRSGAAAENTRLRRRRNCREELPHIRGQGQWLGGPTPRPRSHGCMGAGEPRGAIPLWRWGRAVVRRYPLSKVRSNKAALCWSSHAEIPRVQGKRNPSKTVGVARGHQRADTLKP